MESSVPWRLIAFAVLLIVIAAIAFTAMSGFMDPVYWRGWVAID
jgi:hypothetical protein